VTVIDHRFEALLGPAAPLIAAVFDALPDAIGIHWPVRNEDGALIDFALGYSNPSGARVIGVDLSNDAGSSKPTAAGSGPTRRPAVAARSASRCRTETRRVEIDSRQAAVASTVIFPL